MDNSRTERAPIVVETHPTYKNLFGTIERSWDRSGQTYTDFTRIKAGSLLHAAGGYLVLSFAEILSEPGVYQSLKRTLKSGKVDIQGFDPAYLFTATALKPEPIDVDLKVLLIADNLSYQILLPVRPGFPEGVQDQGGLRHGDGEKRGVHRPLRVVHRESVGTGATPSFRSHRGRRGGGRRREARGAPGKAFDPLQRSRGFDSRGELLGEGRGRVRRGRRLRRPRRPREHRAAESRRVADRRDDP